MPYSMGKLLALAILHSALCIASYPVSRSWKRRSVVKVSFETKRKASGAIFCESTFEVHIKFDLFDLLKDFVFVTRNSFNT
jgi:hypothetical protein